MKSNKSKPYFYRDNTEMKIGDYVTAYRSGIYRVTNIHYTLEKFRNERTYDHWIVDLEKIYDSKMCPRKGVDRCAASYCSKITLESIKAEKEKSIIDAEQKFLTLQRLMSGNYK